MVFLSSSHVLLKWTIVPKRRCSIWIPIWIPTACFHWNFPLDYVLVTKVQHQANPSAGDAHEQRPYDQAQGNDKQWSPPSWAWNSFGPSLPFATSCNTIAWNRGPLHWVLISSNYTAVGGDGEGNSHGSGQSPLLSQLKQQELEFIDRPFDIISTNHQCLTESRSQLMRLWKIPFPQVKEYGNAQWKEELGTVVCIPRPVQSIREPGGREREDWFSV